MSFGNFARKVRDTTLPYRHRVSSLRSCVQLYRPIGFKATLSFLEAEAGRFRTDEAALLRALSTLEASRAAWQAELRTYAAARRHAKKRGRRSPHPTDANPNTPAHWYGARRQAALHAVRFWHRRRLAALIDDDDPTSQSLAECVQACLDADGHLTLVQRRLLISCIDQLATRLKPVRWNDNSTDYFRTRDLLTVARHLETATSLP
ncbi:hypothetical protein [Nonomuraea roseola]|uniref:Uncharacterized protein n=1 Tax=Nonomuraea roseola TaxID=46179 RepID=A0ABV5PRM0_9ACTN